MIAQGFSRRALIGGAAALMGGSVLSGGAAVAARPAVDPADYPSLGLEALGHLNHFHRLARQAPGDWNDMGIQAPTQDGDDALHWQLPFMAYGLAVAQYVRTPAYRELHRGSIGRLIEKMRRTEVWNYWEEASTGEDVFHHDRALVRKADPDPLRHGNVEYSGNALAMMALYELLYRDGKWSRPNAFALRRVQGGDLQEFDYDLPKLTQVALRQFVANGYLGMECEPDGVYPTTCNTFPLQAFMAYDAVYGTRYAAEVVPRHIAAWRKISTLYRTDSGGQAAMGFYISRDALLVSDANTWGKGQFLNVYAADYMRTMYPRWRERLFDIDSDGMLVVKPAPPPSTVQLGPPPHAHHMTQAARPAPREFFSFAEQLAHKVGPVAAEFGDPDLQRAAMKFVNFHNPPIWRDGELYYERNDEFGTPRFLTRRANIVIGSGHVWARNAFHDLYNKPWTAETLQTPELREVDYPKVLVQQAYYDRARDALVVTLLPHGVLPDSRQPRDVDTQVLIANLAPGATYAVTRDGEPIAQVAAGRVTTVGASEAATASPEGLRLRARLRGAPQTYVIAGVRA